jgi:flagellar hook-length control protein FliK
MTPAFLSPRPLSNRSTLPVVEPLQPIRPNPRPGPGAGQAFSDDPFARMLEQNRQAARLQSRRQEQREPAPTEPAPASTTVPEMPPPGSAARASDRAPASANPAPERSRADVPADDQTAAGDKAAAAGQAPGSAGVRRLQATDARPPAAKAGARPADSGPSEAEGDDDRLAASASKASTSDADTLADGPVADTADGRPARPVDPAALLKDLGSRSGRTGHGSTGRAGAGQDLALASGLAAGTTARSSSAALADAASQGSDKFAPLSPAGADGVRAAAFTLADNTTLLARAAGATDERGAGAGITSGTGGQEAGAGLGLGLPAAVAGQGSSSATGTALPTPAQASLPAAPGTDAFGLQLGTQVTLWLKGGIQEAQLQLNPAELGPVRLAITLDGQAAQVSFLAEQTPTRQALEQALPTLAATLAAAGFTLAGGGVFDQARHGHPSDRQDGPASRGTASRDGQAADAGSMASVQQPTRPRGMVDLVA